MGGCVSDNGECKFIDKNERCVIYYKVGNKKFYRNIFKNDIQKIRECITNVGSLSDDVDGKQLTLKCLDAILKDCVKENTMKKYALKTIRSS